LKLPTVVGRSREADLTIAHPMVSRKHCELYEESGLLMIRDLGSLNGTFVNKQRITAPAPLRPQEEFSVGPLTFRADYEYVGPIAAPPMLEFPLPAPVPGQPAPPQPLDEEAGLSFSDAEPPLSGGEKGPLPAAESPEEGGFDLNLPDFSAPPGDENPWPPTTDAALPLSGLNDGRKEAGKSGRGTADRRRGAANGGSAFPGPDAAASVTPLSVAISGATGGQPPATMASPAALDRTAGSTGQDGDQQGDAGKPAKKENRFRLGKDKPQGPPDNKPGSRAAERATGTAPRPATDDADFDLVLPETPVASAGTGAPSSGKEAKPAENLDDFFEGLS
jgi:hypothetical protein